MFGEFKLARSLHEAYNELLYDLELFDTGAIVVRRLAIYLRLLVNTSGHNELLQALFDISRGYFPLSSGEPQAMRHGEKSFFYATDMKEGKLKEYIDSVLTRYMGATDASDREVLGRVRDETRRLFSEMEYEFMSENLFIKKQKAHLIGLAHQKWGRSKLRGVRKWARGFYDYLRPAKKKMLNRLEKDFEDLFSRMIEMYVESRNYESAEREAFLDHFLEFVQEKEQEGFGHPLLSKHPFVEFYQNHTSDAFQKILHSYDPRTGTSRHTSAPTPAYHMVRDLLRFKAKGVHGARLAQVDVIPGKVVVGVLRGQKEKVQLFLKEEGIEYVKIVELDSVDTQKRADEFQSILENGRALGGIILDTDLNASQAKIGLLKTINELEYQQVLNNPLFQKLLSGDSSLSDHDLERMVDDIQSVLPQPTKKTLLGLRLKLFHPSFDRGINLQTASRIKSPKAIVWTLPMILNDPFFFNTLEDRNEKLREKKIRSYIHDYVEIKESEVANLENLLGERYSEFMNTFGADARRIVVKGKVSTESVFNALPSSYQYQPRDLVFVDEGGSERLYKGEEDSSNSVVVYLEGFPLELDKVLIEILAQGGDLSRALIPGLKRLSGRNVFLLKLPTPADFYRQFKTYFRSRQSVSTSS